LSAPGSISLLSFMAYTSSIVHRNGVKKGPCAEPAVFVEKETI
jgi:hypothetical protein